MKKVNNELKEMVRATEPTLTEVVMVNQEVAEVTEVEKTVIEVDVAKIMVNAVKMVKDVKVNVVDIVATVTTTTKEKTITEVKTTPITLMEKENNIQDVMVKVKAKDKIKVTEATVVETTDTVALITTEAVVHSMVNSNKKVNDLCIRS